MLTQVKITQPTVEILLKTNEYFFQAKEGNKGSKRSATDEEPLRTPWELARDREMTNQVENHNVCQMHSRLFYMLYLSESA